MPRSFFEVLSDRLEPQDWKLLIAEQGGRPLGAGLALVFDGVYLLEWVGDTAEGKKVGANQKLYWSAIQDAQASGCHTFSFGRTAVENEGLLAYKRRWGSMEEDMHYISGESTSAGFREEGRAPWPRSAAEAAIKILPQPAYLLFSTFCYQHLG